MPEYDFFDVEKFDVQFQKRLSEIKEPEKVKFLPVGNPFVDNVILAMSIYRDVENIYNLTLKDAIISFTTIDGRDTGGKEFLERNGRSKSIYSVLLNNPLIQASYGKSATKAKHDVFIKPNEVLPSPLQINITRAFMIEFLVSYYNDIMNNINSDHFCISCGIRTSIDFNTIETTISKLVANKDDLLGAGPTRSWFPLVGSISAAQAYSSYSDPYTLCGKCLFSAQFLPQICNMMNGKLCSYQSNNYDFTRKFIEKNIDQYDDLVHADQNEKIENIGKKDSTQYVMINLLEILESMEHLTNLRLTIINYTNSGTDPEVDIYTLPSETLTRLKYMVDELDIKNELYSFIRKENKIIKYQGAHFINCLIKNTDYPLFYQQTYKKDYQLPSLSFYNYYQTSIRGFTYESINLVIDICKQIKIEVDDQKIIQALKEKKNGKLRTLVVPFLLNALKSNNNYLETIIDLFMSNYKEIPNRNPMVLFRFYLHPEMKFPKFAEYEIGDSNYRNLIDRKYLEKVKIFANDVLNIEQTRSSFNLEKYINSLHRLSYIDMFTKFVQIGKISPGYNYNGFHELIDQRSYNKFLFLFRIYSNIELSNFDNNRNKKISLSDIKSKSGLSNELIYALENYINVRKEQIEIRRLFKELPEDLKNGDFSAQAFFDLLNEKIEISSKQSNIEIPRLSEANYYSNGNQNNKFSWHFMRNKVRLYLYQYNLYLKQKPQTLLEQIEEV